MTKKLKLKDARVAGLIPPKKKRTKLTKVSPHTARLILEFAQEHNFVINPVGYGYYVESFTEFKCCPCASDRKSCPCEEAEREILNFGHCKCQLFWRDYKTYLIGKFKGVIK